MQLYTRAASSCSFRIRIALGVKKLKWEPVYVDNAKQQGESYRELNPQGLVPLLIDGDAKIGQTLAIMEYLDEAYPEASCLLPGDSIARARIRAIASYVVADIQPLQNTGLDSYFEKDALHLLHLKHIPRRHLDDAGQSCLQVDWSSTGVQPQPAHHGQGVDIMAWKQYWISYRFERLEKMLQPQQGIYSHGNSITMADCCLIPQVWNALNRYSIDMSKYPAIKTVYDNCVQEAAVADAMPDKQADFTG